MKKFGVLLGAIALLASSFSAQAFFGGCCNGCRYVDVPKREWAPEHVRATVAKEAIKRHVARKVVKRAVAKEAIKRHVAKKAVRRAIVSKALHAEEE